MLLLFTLCKKTGLILQIARQQMQRYVLHKQVLYFFAEKAKAKAKAWFWSKGKASNPTAIDTTSTPIKSQ